MTKRVEVTASRSYAVEIGQGLLPQAGEKLRAVARTQKIAVITESNVAPLYLAPLRDSLTAAGFDVCDFVFPGGESSKNGETYLHILNFLAENRLTRTDMVVALGGGVTGDMAGFAAATYLRGVGFAQIPTTLLAAVDSSVGGKTAIDIPAGKNLAGCFYQPSLVLCDIDTLNTLPDPVFREGCAEVIKYGVLFDPQLFRHLEERGPDFDRAYVIARCVECKRDIVAADEFDTGARQLFRGGFQGGVLAPLGIFPGTVALPAQKKVGTVISERQAVGIQRDIHSWVVRHIFQSQHIGPGLMHPGKIKAGKAHNGIVGGEDDIFRADGAAGGLDALPMDRQGGGVFKNSEPGRQPRQKLEGMELGLSLEAKGAGTAKGQGKLRHKFRRQACRLGCPLLLFQSRPVKGRVDIGVRGLKTAVNMEIPAQGGILPNGLFVGFPIEPGEAGAILLRQLVIQGAVLGCDLGGGFPGLASGDPPRLQNYGAQAPLL